MMRKMSEERKREKRNRKELAKMEALIQTNLFEACHGDFANLPDYRIMTVENVRVNLNPNTGFAASPAWAW